MSNEINTMEFVNYKNVPNFKVDFKGSGLYAIKGKNKIGKTSVLNGIEYAFKALDPTLKPTNIKKEKGENRFNLENKDGDIIEIVEEHQKDAKTKFKMILNENISRKVSDIRDLFKYTSFTAEEFIMMGKTKDGRKKQKSIILNLLPLDDKTLFYDLENNEESLYKERAIINSKVKDSTFAVNNNKLTEEELESLDNYQKIIDLLEKLNKQLNSIESIQKEKSNLISAKKIFNTNIDAALLSLKNSFDENLIEGFNEIIDTANELYDKRINSLEIADSSELNDRINKGNEMLEVLNKLNTKKAIYDDKLVEQTKYIKAQQKVEEDLKAVRLELTNFFDDKNLPINELILKSDDEGLFIRTKEGDLPFDDKQMSTSTMMMITLKIMYHVNIETPILFLGRLESFDNDSLESIIKFAKENDCQIIADKVTNDDKFIFELIVDLDNSETLLEIDANEKIDIDISKKKTKKATSKKEKETKEVSDITENTKEEKIETKKIIDQVELF